MKCLYCKKEIKIKTKLNRKFCSNYCNGHWRYRNNKQHFKDEANRWAIKNYKKRKIIQKKAFKKFYKYKRKRFNELMMKNYYKNKDEWNSRKRTWYYIGKYNLFKNRLCKVCKTINNLEIHHEIYPTTEKKILNAIKNGKIYFLCKKHHYDEKIK